MHVSIEIAAKVVCICLLIVQGGILDGYLAKQHNSTHWVAWIVADISVIILWIVSLALAHRRFKICKIEVDAGKFNLSRPYYGGSLHQIASLHSEQHEQVS